MPLSVRDYNAIGDGVTDDTDAFEHCLMHAATSTPEQAVFVPEGTYRLTRTLIPTVGPIKYIYGVHPDLSVITGDFEGYLFEAYNSTHMVRNLQFTSSATSPDAAHTKGIDLHTNGCHSGLYENLHFENLRQALSIGDGSYVNSFRNITIQSCGHENTYALDAIGPNSNSLSFHNLRIRGDRTWPGRGAHFKGLGITINHLIIQQVHHIEGAVFAATGCTVNGGDLSHGLNADEWPQTSPGTPPPMNQMQIHQRTTFNGVYLHSVVDASRAPVHFIGCWISDLGVITLLRTGNYSTTNCNFE